MFPKCETAQKFSCSETKARYLSTFGLAPYFSNQLISQAKNCGGYVLLFDESLNNQLQENQLDLHVRFWTDNHVETRYLSSCVLGHATANNCFSELEDCILGKGNILQLSMDGPNVNWATYDKLADDISKETDKELYNIGSCGLHIMHNAFKTGYSSLEWDIAHKLNSLYWLFKDSPARRSDFTTLTGFSLFPKKFCSHRWLENVSVCKRALEMWPHVINYVNQLLKKTNCPQTNLFLEVKACSNDPLFTVYLNLFISIAEMIEPFLVMYQTGKPMLPFLADDMKKLVLDILERFWGDNLQKVQTVSQLFLLTSDLLDSKKHKDPTDIDVGYIANCELRNLKKAEKISMKTVYKVKLEAKEFMIKFISKLLEKAPIRYGLVRYLSWLKPSCIIKDSSAAKESLKQCLDYIVQRKRLNKDDVDSVIRQYGDFVTAIAGRDAFISFKKETDRLDELFFSALSINKEWNSLWKIVKDILVLSHGQASVERGFSVNKEIMTDNMQQKTLIAQRTIADHLRCVGGAGNICITKGLFLNASSARGRYEEYIKDIKKKN